MKVGRFRVLGSLLLLQAAGCHLLQLTPGGGTKAPEREAVAGAPGKYSQRVAPYVFLADFELQRHTPLFRELGNLRDQIARDLKIPAGTTPIYVYLFEDKGRYERFMQAKYPDLPTRRAFFVAQPRRFGGTEELMVFTYRGERLQQDLRHELTHALLHSVLKDVPLWLDEGLAEYYEVPPANQGVNFQHLDQLCRPKQGQPKPNLARIEQFNDVQQMNPGEYREAWAWVHFMLRGQPQAKQVLLQYVQELRTNSRPGAMEPRLSAALLSPHEALDRHLAELDKKQRPATAQHGFSQP
jgi:hypothetical protein